MERKTFRQSQSSSLPQRTFSSSARTRRKYSGPPAQFEAQLKTEWAIVQSAAWGEQRNVATVLSGDGELGSILCEVPAEMTIGGQTSHFLGRLACTARKEGDGRKIVLMSVSVATVGQSAAELLAKTKPEMVPPIKR